MRQHFWAGAFHLGTASKLGRGRKSIQLGQLRRCGSNGRRKRGLVCITISISTRGQVPATASYKKNKAYMYASFFFLVSLPHYRTFGFCVLLHIPTRCNKHLLMCAWIITKLWCASRKWELGAILVSMAA